MKIVDIINETADAGSTTSGVFASVAFPLFGKKKMIRRAVDPHGYLESSKQKKKSVGYVNPVDTKGKK
jgi:hypothetical protein